MRLSLQTLFVQFQDSVFLGQLWRVKKRSSVMQLLCEMLCMFLFQIFKNVYFDVLGELSFIILWLKKLKKWSSLRMKCSHALLQTRHLWTPRGLNALLSDSRTSMSCHVRAKCLVVLSTFKNYVLSSALWPFPSFAAESPTFLVSRWWACEQASL